MISISCLTSPFSGLHYHVSYLMSSITLVSLLLSHVSCLSSPVSGITSPVSCLLSHISCLTSLELHLLYHFSCKTSPVSHLLSPVSRLLYPVSRLLSYFSCLTYPVLCLTFPVSGAQHCVQLYLIVFHSLPGKIPGYFNGSRSSCLLRFFGSSKLRKWRKLSQFYSSDCHCALIFYCSAITT